MNPPPFSKRSFFFSLYFAYHLALDYAYPPMDLTITEQKNM